jgi:hypothetical protein
VLCALGFLTKLNFIALAPGMFVGFVLLAARTASISRRVAVRRFAVAAGISLSPIIVYAVVNTVSGHSPLGFVSKEIESEYGSLWTKASYIWQLYLPRLPGMSNDFPGLFTTRQLWFNGFVGRYGWLDTPFPEWANTLALIPATMIILLVARSLFIGRAALRARGLELVVYAIMALGIMVLVGANSFRVFPRKEAEYDQLRYLLPMLPLFAALLVLAVRGAGRRRGPTVAALIVVLFLGHDVFSQLQVIARFYQ